MKILSDLNIDQLKDVLANLGQPSYRAEQIYKWVNLGATYNEMSNLPQKLRVDLALEYKDCAIEIIEKLFSKDGSIKMLYKLCDGNIIEGVYMPHNYGNTLCVSTQVGCRMGCEFCASGLDGLIRNLTAGEILGQVIAVNKDLGGDIKNRKISNIVLMGSGEPLDNYDHVTKFIKLAIDEKGLNISQRSISLSTCGLVDKIYQLADDGFSVTLSISLHASNDENRKKLMPVAKKYSLRELLKAVAYYFNKTGRRIIFEYSMVKNVNISEEDVKRLKELTSKISAHINLIMLNPVKEKNVVGCSAEDAEVFLQKLIKIGISATIRRSVGGDIGGACGQLRRNFVKTPS